MKNNTIYVIIASIVIAVVAIAGVVLISNQSSTQSLRPGVMIPMTNQNTYPENTTSQAQIQGLKKFNSTDELRKFLLDSQAKASVQYTGGPIRGGVLEQRLGLAQTSPTAPVPSVIEGIPASEQQGAKTTASAGVQYSTTNIQVAGIDEPDFLKNDNKYAYILSQDKLTIIDAYPGDAAKIVAKVGLDIKGENLQNMFLNKDRLVVFYNDNTQRYAIPQYDYIPNPVYSPVTHAVIIDVSDKENPKVRK